LARRRDGLRRTGAGPLWLAVRRVLDFFFELGVAFFVDFFRDFALAFEADFLLVTFFRASFRLAFDLPALAVFFLLVFFEAFLLTFFLDFLLFFLLGFFLLAFRPDFLLGFPLVCLPVFRLDFRPAFLPDRVAARLREVFFADFFETRFFELAFLVGMPAGPGWLQMQPAIIHRRTGRESLSERHPESA
jgi:hypothetical protein